MESQLDYKQILQNTQTIAVVGLSDKPHRDSYRIALYMKNQGFKIIPVNPLVTEVLGETAYACLEDIPEPIDMVNVFRRSEALAAIAESAIAIGAKILWTQLGVVDHQAAAKAHQAGLQVVMNRCLLVEHRRLFG